MECEKNAQYGWRSAGPPRRVSGKYLLRAPREQGNVTTTTNDARVLSKDSRGVPRGEPDAIHAACPIERVLVKGEGAHITQPKRDPIGDRAIAYPLPRIFQNLIRDVNADVNARGPHRRLQGLIPLQGHAFRRAPCRFVGLRSLRARMKSSCRYGPRDCISRWAVGGHFLCVLAAAIHPPWTRRDCARGLLTPHSGCGPTYKSVRSSASEGTIVRAVPLYPLFVPIMQTPVRIFSSLVSVLILPNPASLKCRATSSLVYLWNTSV